MRLRGAAAALTFLLSACGSQQMWPPAPPGPARAPEPLEQPGQMDSAPAAAPEPSPPAPAPKPEAKPEPKHAPQVAAGIAAYDDGRHKEAAKLLRAALTTQLGDADQVTARKYLAFIECSAGRRSQCRQEFQRALKIDPSFDLEPAEAGHPVWGPIFRALKKPAKKK